MEEHPVALKPKSASKKQSSSKSDSVSGRSCIIHFADTLETAITPLKDQSFSKIKNTAAKRLKLSDAKDKLIEISSNIPTEFDSSLHGYHRRCYQLFILLPKPSKRKATSSMYPDDEAPSTSKKSKRFSSASSTVLFPPDKCLFCDKDTMYVKRERHSLVTCMTIVAEQSIKSAAVEKDDEEILRKVRGQDLRAREARYHNHCRRNYTRNKTRHLSHEDSESSQSQAAHNAAFQFIKSYIEKHLLTGGNIERLSMIRERYLTYLLDNHPNFYNKNYKMYKLKDKLQKYFGTKLSFWQTQTKSKSELVYAADIEGEAVEVAFELAASDERRLTESAMIIRRHIHECRLESEPMPWPPSAAWLLSGERRPPEILLTFLISVITGKPTKHASSRSQRYALSLAEDLCYTATNGEWIMPKHLTLPMTVIHLTGNAEVVTILNRYGHGQSYSRTLELETAM